MASKLLTVDGYAALCDALVGRTKSGPPVFIHFSGGVDSTTGKSWCPDCVTADPVITSAVETMLKPQGGDYLFVHCSVGAREFWKDAKNPFRTDDAFKVAGVPTLLLWNQNKRLVEGQCAKSSLVEMLLEEGLA